MQNYTQQPQGYQRSGSTASFGGQQGPPPPPYGVSHGYQAASPQAQSQWAPPVQNPAPVQQQQQWNQPSQQGTWGQAPQQQQQPNAPAYNPGTYGAMPGAYNQGQGSSIGTTTNTQSSNAPFQSHYTTQSPDQPPPPPPKPPGFASSVQQQQPQQPQQPQGWPQQSTYGTQQPQQSFQSPQQPTGFTQGQQGDASQQGHQSGYQQPYNNPAPPPPPQTSGGSFFPPNQGGATPAYGADQSGTYTTSPSAATQQGPVNFTSPDEQHPAYIPPSLTGQGVQSYTPTNTNPLPGVYVPPPPDIPAWQPASHAPLQGGGNKFKYTKPMVEPGLNTSGPQQYQTQFAQQGVQVQQPQQSQGQFGQQPFAPQPQLQYQPQGQFGQPPQPPQQFGQPQLQDQFQQQQQYSQGPQGNQVQQPVQQFPQQENQWQPTPPADQGFVQQQQPAPAPFPQQQPVPQHGWQPNHQVPYPASSISPQYPQGHEQDIQAPKPINGQTGYTPPNFINLTSPQSQPVSPVQNRQSMSFGAGQNQSNLGRTSSVSSIALGALRNQQAANKTSSPAPQKEPAHPLPQVSTSASAFSALGSGGPSDWEHFGQGEEIDDEDMFGAKTEGEKSKPVPLDSVELPVQPSPPQTTADWPTPLSQPAQPNVGIQRRDTYQPTPPPKASEISVQQPMQPPQQSFVMTEDVITDSPQPTQASQPPPAQQNFVVDDGGWPAAKQDPPAQQQQQVLPPTQNSFVMDNGSGVASAPADQNRQDVPVQQHPTKPVVQATAFVMDDGGWGPSQQTSTQTRGGWGQQAQTHDMSAALKAKDDAYERLKAESEKEKAELQAEIGKLMADVENAKTHSAAEKTVLNEQLESMRMAADQDKRKADAMNKEKDATIERLKEDIEGKDDTISERDATISNLKRQLEAERSKEVPQPTAQDLLPAIDPWYAGSLERYVAMLKSEATEAQVEDKIRVFTSFLKAESGVRGVLYYSAPPPVETRQEKTSHTEGPAGLIRGVSNASVRKQDIHVQVPQQSQDAEEQYTYSPGGRPILQKKPNPKSNDSVASEHSFIMSAVPEQPVTINVSAQSTAILTPTSSTGDDVKTPIQSPPEEPSQQQYKAYDPSNTGLSNVTHKMSLSFATPSFQPSTTGKQDEIFFGRGPPPSGPQPSSKSTSRPTTSLSTHSDSPVPAPLSFKQSTSASTPTKTPLETLSDLLPKQIVEPQPNVRLNDIRKQAQSMPSDFTYINDLTTSWEKSATLIRKKNDAARHKRQEESEATTDQLFNDNEISYADIGDIEDEFKEKERELKAQEDRNEYKTFIEEVFDKVYDSLQGDIKALMDLYIEAETLLHSSVSGVQALERADIPSTKDCLDLLRELQDAIEVRHEKVVSAVAERDKRYKKTEVQPLYAAGNIPKMKSVEKHFEIAEKQAILRAKSEKAERIGELVKVAEDVVIQAVGVEQREADRIVAAIKSVSSEAEDGKSELLTKARDTLTALKASSKDLLQSFNRLEIELNTAVLDAEIAHARVENAEPAKIKEIEKDMSDGESRLRDEFERRVGVLEQDATEIDNLLQEKGLEVVLTEEQERERRMKAALEEAKRRNGHA